MPTVPALRPLPVAAAAAGLAALVAWGGPPATVITAWHPTDPDQAHVAEVSQPRTLLSLAPQITAQPVACKVNDEWVLRAGWCRQVQPGDTVVFAVLPLGGNTGKVLRTVALIAIAAVAIYVSGGAAAGYFAQFGAYAGLAQTAASAAILIGGQLLVNALLPVQLQGAGATGIGDVAGASPTYNAALSGNQPRLYQPIPVRYGRERVFLDYAQPPYNEFDDSGTQLFKALYMVGQGNHQPEGVFFDDTPATNYAQMGYLWIDADPTGAWIKRDFDTNDPRDGEYVIVGEITETDPVLRAKQIAAKSVRLHMIASGEVSGQELTDNLQVSGPFTVCDSQSRVKVVYLDMLAPRGVGQVNPSTGALTTYTIVFQPQYQVLQNGVPVGDWIPLVNADSDSANAYSRFTGATTTPQRKTFMFVLPNAYQIQVRVVRRGGKRTDSNLFLDDLSWVGLRSELYQGAIATRRALRGPWTFVALRIKAVGQLGFSSSRKFATVQTRMLPTRVNGAWTAEMPTRNPAWAACDVVRNQVYGGALDDSRLALDRFSELADTWRARGDWFDGSFDTARPLFDALGAVTAAGRAIPYQRMGVVSAVRDQPMTTPRVVFSERNTIEGSVSIVYAQPDEDTPDSFETSYIDARTWKPTTFLVAADGGNVSTADAERPQKRELFGVTDYLHARREAAFFAATQRLRREFPSWESEAEGLGLELGDMVNVQHQLFSASVGGDVEAYDPATRKVVLSEPLPDVATPRLVFSDSRGRPVGPLAYTRDTSDANGCTAILAANPPDGFLPYTGGARERTRYVAGDLPTLIERARVLGITPRGGYRVALAAVVEADAVHTADAEWLPAESQAAYESGGTPIPKMAETGDISAILPPPTTPPGGDPDPPDPDGPINGGPKKTVFV